MKVTKTIREYVEAQVSAKADVYLSSFKKRADEAREAYENDAKAVEGKFKEMLHALMTKHNIPDGSGGNCYFPIDSKIPACRDYYDARSAVRAKIPRIVTEILATMELGGTKAELMELINNVTF